MMLIKKITLMLILTFITNGLVSCKTDKIEAKERTDAGTISKEASSDSQTKLGDVFKLEGVTKAPKGKANDFTWKDGSKTVTFSEFTKNKVVLLNFWGTWCGPCRMEIPDLKEVVNELNGKDFVVIGVPLERNPSNAITTVQTFVKNNNLNYVNIVDVDRKLDAAYGGISGVPTTIIIDKQGNVSEAMVGAQPKDRFMKAINRVLK